MGVQKKKEKKKSARNIDNKYANIILQQTT